MGRSIISPASCPAQGCAAAEHESANDAGKRPDICPAQHQPDCHPSTVASVTPGTVLLGGRFPARTTPPGRMPRGRPPHVYNPAEKATADNGGKHNETSNPCARFESTVAFQATFETRHGVRAARMPRSPPRSHDGRLAVSPLRTALRGATVSIGVTAALATTVGRRRVRAQPGPAGPREPVAHLTALAHLLLNVRACDNRRLTATKCGRTSGRVVIYTSRPWAPPVW